MTNRVLVFATILLTITHPMLVEGQPSLSDGAGVSAEPPAPADGSAARPELSAEDAIRAAADDIDLLESTDEEEARRALLEKISRSIEVVESRSPGNPWLYYLHGRVHALSGSGLDAAKLLQKFVETRAGRNEWRAHRVLGDLFVDRYPRLARANYKTADGLKRDAPTVQLGLSKCAFALGDIDDAVSLAGKAVDMDTQQDLRYTRHLTSMLMAQQSWSEAQRVAQRGLTMAQASAHGRSPARASLEALDEQYRLLIEILQHLADATPDNADTYIDMSNYLRLQAENAGALARHDALRALQLGVDSTAPNTPVRLLEQYAIALAEAGLPDRAVAQFEMILTRDAGNSLAAEWLARLKPDEPLQPPQHGTRP